MEEESRQEKKFEELRRQAESLVESAGEEQSTFSRNFMDLLHELNVHQKELEIQNEELQEAQDELDSLYREYMELYEFAPAGYVTLTPKGIVCRANLTAVRMLGAERSILTRSALSRFVDRESSMQYVKTLELARETGYPQRAELKLKPRQKDTQKDSQKDKEESEALWVQADTVADMTGSEELRQWRITLTDITDRVRAENEVRRLLQEKRELLREVHHRVKNHMTSILSIISYQISQYGDRNTVAALTETRNRFNVMLKIYDTLFSTEEAEYIDLEPFIRTLVRDIREAHIRDDKVRINVSVDEIRVSAKDSFPIGLVVNEALSNATKYAFPEDRDGTVDVTVSQDEEGRIRILVADDGAGMPEEKRREENFGFGLTLIQRYAQQYAGSLDISKAKGGGTAVTVTLVLDDSHSLDDNQ